MTVPQTKIQLFVQNTRRNLTDFKAVTVNNDGGKWVWHVDYTDGEFSCPVDDPAVFRCCVCVCGVWSTVHAEWVPSNLLHVLQASEFANGWSVKFAETLLNENSGR